MSLVLEAAERRADQAEERATSALALLREAAETLKTAEARAVELQRMVDGLQEELARAAQAKRP